MSACDSETAFKTTPSFRLVLPGTSVYPAAVLGGSSRYVQTPKSARRSAAETRPQGSWPTDDLNHSRVSRVACMKSASVMLASITLQFMINVSLGVYVSSHRLILRIVLILTLILTIKLTPTLT